QGRGRGPPKRWEGEGLLGSGTLPSGHAVALTLPACGRLSLSPNGRGRAGLAHAAQGAYMPLMPSALYNREILRLAASIPHLGRLGAPQASVEKSSPICGSR